MNGYYIFTSALSSSVEIIKRCFFFNLLMGWVFIYFLISDLCLWDMAHLVSFFFTFPYLACFYFVYDFPSMLLHDTSQFVLLLLFFLLGFTTTFMLVS